MTVLPVGFVVPGLGSSLTKAAAGSVFDAMSTWVAAGAQWLVLHVLRLAGRASPPVQLGSVWLGRSERTMDAVAFMVAGPLVGVATIGAVVHQDGRRLLRIYAAGIPIGMAVGAAGITAAGLALQEVNAMCTMVVPGRLATSFAKVVGHVASPDVPAFVQFIVAVVVVLGAFALWLELVLRATAIDLAVFFFPLALATVIWPSATPIARRFVEVLAALIGSKFVIVATLALGASAVGAEHPGLDAAITGAAVLLLAAFAPFAVLRLIPLIEVAAVAHLEGLSRRPARAAVGAAMTASSLASGPAGGILEQLTSRGGGDLQPASVAGVAIAEHAGDWTAEHGFVEAPRPEAEVASPARPAGGAVTHDTATHDTTAHDTAAPDVTGSSGGHGPASHHAGASSREAGATVDPPAAGDRIGSTGVAAADPGWWILPETPADRGGEGTDA